METTGQTPNARDTASPQVRTLRFIGRGWRRHLGDIVASAERSVLVVVPFVKHREATWLCDRMRPGVHVTTLANIDAAAVSTSALDISGLQCLASASGSAKLIALPNLHAKVFVADNSAAIVTSGNLTSAALDHNIEYGVSLHDAVLVRKVREDMMSYAQLGSPVDADFLAELLPLEKELRKAQADLLDSGKTAFKQKLDEAMRRARPAFASAQVGNRSAHAVFGDAIQFVLREGPQMTKDIHREVQALLPALCDDGEYFLIRGERYGRTWKRRVRHAQQHLKKKGIVIYDKRTRTWALTRG